MIDIQKFFVIQEIHVSLEFSSIIIGLEVEMAHFELSFAVKNVRCQIVNSEQHMDL